MKAVLVITLSFLFASLTNLPLGFSKNDAEPVFDVGGNPLQLGGKYYILPAIRGPPGGGVRLGKTENSNCP
ncbi:Kunitz-type trypsin inhibitor-like 2 protein, partial [Mucuna pruriens]